MPKLEKHKLLVKRNRLEQALFDLPERTEAIFEGVEDSFCGVSHELEPALAELGPHQFETEELEPFFGPFLQYDYLAAFDSDSAVAPRLATLPTFKSLERLGLASVAAKIATIGPLSRLCIANSLLKLTETMQVREDDDEEVEDEEDGDVGSKDFCIKLDIDTISRHHSAAMTIIADY